MKSQISHMGDPVRVLVLGSGQMGSGIARLVLEKQGLDLVGVFAKRPERAGMNVGRAIGLERDLDLRISADLTAAIDQTAPQVAIQATCSKLSEAMVEISTLVRRGVHVISIAEEMAYPAHRSPGIADEMHGLAVANGVGVVGTGINPGFVLDLLVIALTGVCSDIQSINAERINDLSPYGPTVLTSQGVGLEPEAFYSGVDDGTVVGHYGFAESIHMIAAALAWDIERIDEDRTPIVSNVRRATPFVTVEAGRVAGCLHKAIAYRQGEPVITLLHPQQVHPQLEGVQTGDRIEISGTPDVRLAGSPEIPGGIATCALAVNMIPRLLNTAPGLYSTADLPVPSAILGDARRRIRNRFAEHRHG
jgi:4-hydroxy-tetrahydrodipicolinate reductase